MSYSQIRFIFSLTVAAVVSSVLEEKDVSHIFLANIDLSNNQGMETTPPTSFRILASVILCCLSTPSIHKSYQTIQSVVLFTVLAITVIVAIHSSNRITRLCQSVYLGVVLWLVGTSMFANEGLNHMNRINKALLAYISITCIKSTFEVCISSSTDPISAGCKSCDVVMNVLVSCAASAILADALISYHRESTPNVWITVTSTCLAATCYVLSIFLVGRIIAHNPSYLPARFVCQQHPLDCDAQMDRNLLDRRNSIVAYSPGSVGLITLIQFVMCYNQSTHIQQNSNLMRYTSILSSVAAGFIAVFYFAMLILLCVQANVSFAYQGNDLPIGAPMYMIPWLTDASIVLYLVGVILALNGFPRIGVGVMQLGIIFELTRGYIEYGDVKFFSFFTMNANIFLVIVAFIGIVAANRTLWLDWIVLVGRGIALLLTLAYICAFSIVDGLRSEQFVNIQFDQNTSVLYEHKRITMLGVRAGARAIILHFAQLPAFMILFTYFVTDCKWKWAVEQQRTLSWIVWIGSCALLIGLYFVLTLVVLEGFPSSYPLSDHATVTVGTIFVVVLPFLCAL